MFLEWLIMQGKDVFYSVWDDPKQVLDTYAPDGIYDEDVLVAMNDSFHELGGFGGISIGRIAGSASGSNWDPADLPSEYPLLCEKFEFEE